MKLYGKTAFVTGAARGIGKAVAETFAQNGATVYANDIQGELLAETVRELSGKYGADVIALTFDVTDTAAQKEAFQRIWKERKRLDILVNNAGISVSALIEMTKKSDVEQHFAINTIAVIEMTQYAAKLMKRNEIINNTRGSIINISSIAGVYGNRGQLAYSASKAAVLGISKSTAKELSGDLIRVNTIAPGVILTPMLEEGLPKDILEDYVTNFVGMHRIGTAKEVADTVLFFASDESAYITGQVLCIDGGFLI